MRVAQVQLPPSGSTSAKVVAGHVIAAMLDGPAAVDKAIAARPAPIEAGMIVRLFRPDLVCGLGGFMLGAAALLVTTGVTGHPAPLPQGDTDILLQAHAVPAPHPSTRRN